MRRIQISVPPLMPNQKEALSSDEDSFLAELPLPDLAPQHETIRNVWKVIHATLMSDNEGLSFSAESLMGAVPTP